MRTVILYILVVAALRIMGKRQIGELQPSELVVTIMISELATIPISEKDISLLNGIIPILVVVVCEIIISYAGIKSQKFRVAVSGRPSYIIKDGIIDQKEMKKTRYSIYDLLEELRMMNVFDISAVWCAILETNGKISVITRECMDDRAYVLVCDGQVQENTLEDSPFNKKDLKNFIGKKPLDKIFLLSVDSNKKTFCVLKDE